MKRLAERAGADRMLALLLLLFLPADAAAKLSVDTAHEPDEPVAVQLGQVRRIYVDVFTGGESAARLREFIIGALHRSKMFIITENEERADAILRGAGKDDAYTDRFHTTESSSAHTGFGTSDGESVPKLGAVRNSRNVTAGLGDAETIDIEERKHEATAAVRLVSPDGDVIWSTTQESGGAKFLSASEDVAERVARQLANDYRRERCGAGSCPAAASQPAQAR